MTWAFIEWADHLALGDERQRDTHIPVVRTGNAQRVVREWAQRHAIPEQQAAELLAAFDERTP